GAGDRGGRAVRSRGTGSSPRSRRRRDPQAVPRAARGAPVIRVVLATRNAGKLRDLQHLLGGTFAVLPVPDGVPEVEETGATFVATAVLKARAVSAATGLPAFGDDSGLEVDALGGEPGVYSARYAGAGAGDAANNAKLLARLAGVPPDRRAARFRSAVAFADAAGRLGGDVLLG